MLLEITGFPGSGKTTLSRALIERLGEAGFKASLRPSVLRGKRGYVNHMVRYPMFCLTHPRLVASVLGYGFSIRPFRWSRFRHLREVLFWTYYSKRQTISDYDLVLVDQGGLQAAWAAAVDCNTVSGIALEKLLSKKRKSMGYTVKYLFVDVSPRCAARRLKESRDAGARSGTGRFDFLATGQAINALQKSDPLMKQIYLSARNVAPEHVLHLDGRNSIDEMVETVLGWIKLPSAPDESARSYPEQI
jgi:hypothetical protein